MHAGDDRPSTLIRYATGLRADGRVGPLRLLVEATLFTLIGAALVAGAGLADMGLLTVFLATAALDGRTRRILAGDGDRARTAASLVAIFVGVALAFVGIALVLDAGELPGRIGATLASEARGSILDRRFDVGVMSLLSHNLGTMALFAVLTFVYRSFGAMLALAYNAAAWAVVLTTLILVGAGETSLSTPLFVLGALGAVLPHLVAELTGYALAALAAWNASRAAVGATGRGAALRNALALLMFAVAALMLAAALEHRFAPFALARLR